MIDNNKLTILVCSSDGYEDLWEPFFTLFKKNWPECNLRIILNTESKKIQVEGCNLNFVESNDFSNLTYGSRMIHHLKSIESEYTLLLLDDFFIRDKVNEELLEDYIEIMDSDKKIAAINFDPSERGGKEYYTNDSRLIKLPEIAPYKLNMQGCIWKTEFLLNSWDSSDNPWLWESFGNYTTFNSDYDFLHISDIRFTPINYGYNPKGMGVYRGKWVYDDVFNLFNQNNIEIDYSVRGVYDPNEKVVLFKDKKHLNKYIYNRLSFEQYSGFISFKLLKKIGFFKRYYNHTEYLSNKNNI